MDSKHPNPRKENDMSQPTNDQPNANPPEEEAIQHGEDDVTDIQAKLEEDIAQLKEQYIRTMADIENMRKRHEREKEDSLKYGMSQFVEAILPVVDNLQRAIDLVKTKDHPFTKTILEGLEMTHKELDRAFEKFKIEKIDPMEKTFDHNLHQAMFEVPTEEHAPGTVVQVMQAGYKIHDRLLRPAMVGVAKETDSNSDSKAKDTPTSQAPDDIS